MSPTEFRPLDRILGGLGFLGAIGALAVVGGTFAVRGTGRRETASDAHPDRGWWLTACTVWVLAVLAFHLVNRSGFPRYLYHALAPATILAAHGLDLLIHERVRARHLAGTLLLGAIVLAVLVRLGRLPRSEPDLEGLRAAVRKRIPGPVVPFVAAAPEPTAGFIVYYLDRTPRRVPADDLVGVEYLLVEHRPMLVMRERGAVVLATVGRVSLVRAPPPDAGR